MIDYAKKLNNAFTGNAASLMQEPHQVVGECETLAMLLSYASNASDFDCDQKARDLLEKFQSTGGVLRASTDTLRSEGLNFDTITLLHTILAAQLHVLMDEITQGTEISCASQLTDYLTASMARVNVERFKVMFLDRKNMLITDEIMSVGSVDNAPAYPREIAKRGLKLDACAVILAHNHPSGNPQPSEADIIMTKNIINACNAVNINVHDHVVVGHNNHFASMAAMGFVENYPAENTASLSQS